MKKGVTFLFLWLVCALVFSSVFIPAIPPSGVIWPYYLFVASIPFGALLYARFDKRLSVVISYGLLAGVWFALPIFYDIRKLFAGVTSDNTVALKIGLFALAMTLSCAAAFVFGRTIFKRKTHGSMKTIE